VKSFAAVVKFPQRALRTQLNRIRQNGVNSPQSTP
jgi:hypothetical protein